MPVLRQPRQKTEPEPKPQLQTEAEPFEASDEEQNVNTDESKVVKVAEDKSEAEAAAELKKQMEALRRGEAEQRRRAEESERRAQEAIRQVQAKDSEVEKARTEIIQSRADVINRAIAAETEAGDAAEREYSAALTSGDTEAAVKAQRRMARAEANLANLQNGKAAIEAEIEEAKNRPAPKVEEQAKDPLDNFNIPETAKRWLRAHPEYLSDQRKNAKIQSLHWDVVDEGHEPFSDAYYESLETHLGMRNKAESKKETETEDERPSIVSAPVSREVPSSNGSRDSGRIKLTQEQRDFARISGITETEYAKQLIKLEQEKKVGNYGERR